MKKVLLALDSEIEKRFLEKLLKRLGFHVIVVGKTQNLGAELAANFPDVVFSSVIGKKSQVLDAVARIKASKGIPKVIFVRQAKDKSPLSQEQKDVVDRLVESPIDPFQLIEALSFTTGVTIEQLKGRYRDVVARDGKEAPQPRAQQNSIQSESRIVDTQRKKRYSEICDLLREKNKEHSEFDGNKFKQYQRSQAKAAKRDEKQIELQKQFVTSLFSVPVKK